MSDFDDSVEDDEYAVDPALTASLGFSSFGTQPSAKKRKYTHNDAFVDPAASMTPAAGSSKNRPKGAGKGANTLPLGARKNPSPNDSLGPVVEDGNAGERPSVPTGITQLSTAERKLPVRAQQTLPKVSTREVGIEAYRHGVKQPNGDTAYFLPSFLEDPWAGMSAKSTSA